MIKYLGSKRKLIPELVRAVSNLTETGTVLDLFSGTSRVGIGLSNAGYSVISNDINTYALHIARCYLASSHHHDEQSIESSLSAMVQAGDDSPRLGYFTKTFCNESRFFQPKNGVKIDAMRNHIADRVASGEIDQWMESILLTSLMEAADRVDSTVGLQMSYLKTWAKRSYNELDIRVPKFAEGLEGEAHQLDAFDAATMLSSRCDVTYLDPPYNQHKYLGNYHIWETLCRWDQPEHYGVARKRVDVRDRKSPFYSKKRKSNDELTNNGNEFERVIGAVQSKYAVVSFSDEGFISLPEMMEILSRGGREIVGVNSSRQVRYVGAQIGVYNPYGAKVGKVSHLKNNELIYSVRIR